MNPSKLRPSAYLPQIALGAVLIALAIGFVSGIALGVLALAAVALLVVVSLLWGSVSSLSGDTPLTLDEAIGFGAPSVEEEQKRSVLRALKDLEFERSVGKISEQDFQEFSARYRAEAKRLIAVLDQELSPAHALAETLATQRLAAAGLATADEAKREPVAKDESVAKDDPVAESEPVDDASPEAAAPPSAAPTCPSCRTTNDADARFCKRCGASLKAPEPSAVLSANEAKAEEA